MKLIIFVFMCVLFISYVYAVPVERNMTAPASGNTNVPEQNQLPPAVCI